MTNPKTYFERYVAGERGVVYEELIRLDSGVRQGPLFDDALAVARETVRRATHNVELIYRRLLDLGYRFAHPEAAFVLAGPEAAERIAEMERRMGTFPLLAQAWYESMASVDFTQADAQLRGSDGGVNGLGRAPVLIMRSLDRCWEEWLAACEEHEHHLRQVSLMAAKDPDDPFLKEQLERPMVPFLLTGGSASNCDPNGFVLPCLAVDGVFNEFDDTYFVDALRWYFEWGGFPLCQSYAEGNEPPPHEAMPDWTRVVPLLRHELLEL